MLNQFSYKERYEFQNLLQETVRFPRCKSYLTQRQIFQCKTTTTKNKKNTGDPTAWVTFKALFESKIDHVLYLSDIEKFN